MLAKASGRFILIVAAAAIAGYLLKFLWTGLLPVILAILVATVLYPVTAWMRTKLRFPGALAAATTLLGFFAIVTGIFAAMAPTVKNQSQDLIHQAQGGIDELIKLGEKLPVDIDETKVQQLIDDVTNAVKGQASHIATGVMSGFSTVSSIVVTIVIMLFLTFFFIKEGEKFLPWMRKYTGFPAGWHMTELCNRIWKTLSGYIQAQATVALVDAVLIGLGLMVLQVPLAFVIGVVTFFASFIPLVGAITAGALAVIVALVSHGLTTALLALLVVVAVQQIEGNVLQPILQSKAMGLHAAVILLSVTVGSALAGIIGAFLAVPVAATIGVTFRYQALVTAIRAGEVDPNKAEIVTGAPKPKRKARLQKQKEDSEAHIDASGSSPELDAARSVEKLDPDSPRAKVRELYNMIAPRPSA
ncbi:TPA: AI-2E family transporter [Corynebacterium striatum]|nr:AI-2E family transporter [Corynebacterium striatum]HAT1175385.1 AI-2E family transporter [Corynebacterium striatum]HAT1328641.1 AI-2E family transporter [Corynebacterium striatum]HAT1330323.1 AI-2E family transporter [Corynebacterium striatum]HAT1337627.1 AI-2E family transporter [Corynebacterium striatum]